MHMADALLSPAVGLAFCGAGFGAVLYGASKIKKEETFEKTVPMMGVLGAFVFAAQMINFTIPGTGSSGHIGGGILLAALLGPFPALLTMACILAIQALFFADGGLLALGCNIFNMGVLPCLVAYPLVFKPLVKGATSAGRISAASFVSSVLALQIGAFFVVLQTLLSGITALPFSTFALLMQPIHLAIGIGEGLATASVLCFVHKMRPEIMANLARSVSEGVKRPLKPVLIAFGVLALVTAGGLSLFASSFPDGLEWSIEKTSGTAEQETHGALYENAAAIQKKTAIMPDYSFASETAGEEGGGTSAAGIIGSLMTFLLAAGAGYVLLRMKRTALVKTP